MRQMAIANSIVRNGERACATYGLTWCCMHAAVAALSTQLSTAALDKNPQSQERGITLDLGFSSFTVPLPQHLRGIWPCRHAPCLPILPKQGACQQLHAASCSMQSFRCCCYVPQHGLWLYTCAFWWLIRGRVQGAARREHIGM